MKAIKVNGFNGGLADPSNYKIILKKNKISCECCFCFQRLGFDINGQNVFQITKQEHDKYKAGGVWRVEIEWNSYEDQHVLDKIYCSRKSSASESFESDFLSGCEHDFRPSISYTTYYTGECADFGNVRFDPKRVFTETNDFYTSQIFLLLHYENNKFYAKYVINGPFNASSEFKKPRVPEYKPYNILVQNVDFSMDGNKLIAFGHRGESLYWTKENYRGEYFSKISATFIPKNEM